MTFFERQEKARRNTFILIGYFVLAVICIIVSVYFIVGFLLFSGTESAYQTNSTQFGFRGWWNPELFTVISLCTFVIVLGGSFFKILRLSGGGADVAKMLGGRLIDPNSRDYHERRVLNVVEEMAIASGVPVPPVYVMDDEPSINAFAAGFSPKDAVVGVSAGCIHSLTRDELQGVMAHEFSHILNGDMRLNIRLIGVVFGILVIAMIGRVLMRSASRSRRSSSKDNGGAIVLAGLGLFVVGYIGVFFGKLIKAAVSRQREFLADASAVQFTRDPLGISGALKKIGGLVYGSQISEAHAEETSHMFFGNGVGASFLSLLSTHPPLDVRIKAIDPRFDGVFPAVNPEQWIVDTESKTTTRPGKHEAVGRLAGAGTAVQFDPHTVMQQIGAPQREHLLFASALLDSLSETLRNATHEPQGACAVVYALLIASSAGSAEDPLMVVAKYTDDGVFGETKKLLPLVESLGPQGRLPLADMVMPALGGLSEKQYSMFTNVVEKLIQADGQRSLFEYALQIMILRHLDAKFRKRQVTVEKYKHLKQVVGSIRNLLSVLAVLGHKDGRDAERAFNEAIIKVHPNLKGRIGLVSTASLNLLEGALSELAMSSASIKERVIEACIVCISSDGTVAIEEAELMRAIAGSLDCPIPPFLPGQSLEAAPD